MPKRICFISLGCPRNFVDTEVMLTCVKRAGYEVTASEDEADFLIVNTCAFLQIAREESIETIASLFSKKKRGAKVIITGCMVMNHKDQLKELFPNVHFYLGAGDISGILEAIGSPEKGEKTSGAKSFLEEEGFDRQIATSASFAYLKIAEGCCKGCSYCLIPKIKGPLKSKPLAQIVQEFRHLLALGIKEVILIAQDLGDWGRDLARDSSGKGPQLVDLLKELLKCEGDFWLRLLYLYPDEISDELIALMKSDGRICPYLDMPIQHISDTILKKMHRKTSGREIRERLITLRKEIPDIHIRTSLIVGFPGESEADFLELSEFLREFKLHHVGLFAFSPEEGTRAAQLPDQVAEDVKSGRVKKLSELQMEIVEKINRKKIGQTLEVVVEGYHPESSLLMVGRHRGQAPEIDGQVIINDPRKIKAFHERYVVKVTDVCGFDLIAKPIKKFNIIT